MADKGRYARTFLRLLRERDGRSLKQISEQTQMSYDALREMFVGIVSDRLAAACDELAAEVAERAGDGDVDEAAVASQLYGALAGEDRIASLADAMRDMVRVSRRQVEAEVIEEPSEE